MTASTNTHVKAITREDRELTLDIDCNLVVCSVWSAIDKNGVQERLVSTEAKSIDAALAKAARLLKSRTKK